jgi:hypothetical protein
MIFFVTKLKSHPYVYDIVSFFVVQRCNNIICGIRNNGTNSTRGVTSQTSSSKLLDY